MRAVLSPSTLDRAAWFTGSRSRIVWIRSVTLCVAVAAPAVRAPADVRAPCFAGGRLDAEGSRDNHRVAEDGACVAVVWRFAAMLCAYQSIHTPDNYRKATPGTQHEACMLCARWLIVCLSTRVCGARTRYMNTWYYENGRTEESVVQECADMVGFQARVQVIGVEVSTESKDAQNRKVIRVDNLSFGGHTPSRCRDVAEALQCEDREPAHTRRYCDGWSRGAAPRGSIGAAGATAVPSVPADAWEIPAPVHSVLRAVWLTAVMAFFAYLVWLLWSRRRPRRPPHRRTRVLNP